MTFTNTGYLAQRGLRHVEVEMYHQVCRRVDIHLNSEVYACLLRLVSSQFSSSRNKIIEEIRK